MFRGGSQEARAVLTGSLVSPVAPRRKLSKSAPVQRKESFTSHIGIQHWER